MPRIISLIASATEIVCALGRQSDLVGRSHECDYPRDIMRLPVCTRPRFPVKGPSEEIDRQVKALLAEGSPIYEVDRTLLDTLRPDLILTQSHCVVCAVSDADVERALGSETTSRPRIISLAPNAIADLWDSIASVADAIGVPDRGALLIQSLRHRVADIADVAQNLPTRPSVACLEWLSPLMAAGNWVPELVEFAGGVNLFGVAGKHSPWMSWDDLLEQDPDRIIALPCGFDLIRTRAELPALTRDPRFARLKAVQTNNFLIADGNQFFNRPGPRLVESLEILAEIIHPERFDFGHQGSGWARI